MLVTHPPAELTTPRIWHLVLSSSRGKTDIGESDDGGHASDRRAIDGAGRCCSIGSLAEAGGSAGNRAFSDRPTTTAGTAADRAGRPLIPPERRGTVSGDGRAARLQRDDAPRTPAHLTALYRAWGDGIERAWLCRAAGRQPWTARSRRDVLDRTASTRPSTASGRTTPTARCCFCSSFRLCAATASASSAGRKEAA